MKTLTELSIVLYFLSLIGLITSCEKKAKVDELFIISVDSIKFPEKIFANTPFDILCFGTIGINGCNSFSHFETENVNHVISVAALGEFQENSSVCPAVMVYLEGEKLNLKLEKGSYLLKIKRNDGTFLERQLIIE